MSYIKPFTGHVLIKILPKDKFTISGIEIPDHTITPEEAQQASHHPTPPPPLTGEVLAIGPWKRLNNGLAVMPPFKQQDKVLIRNGTGKELTYGTRDKLRMVRQEDVLAVVTEA